eukprot:TRINITY_DN31958_c0_g1_i1.p1 TRINITY_DN31958_c0_g1~~TRINITY_DN31958_c0_g1_i1.p1  ORF type:complete len:1592 (+),score=415.02 TRINITY_DN31958_c0_g1_i1:431-4777(+)
MDAAAAPALAPSPGNQLAESSEKAATLAEPMTESSKVDAAMGGDQFLDSGLDTSRLNDLLDEDAGAGGHAAQVDDDMSEDDMPLSASFAAPPPASAAGSMTKGRPGIASQQAACKAKIAELKKLKDHRLEQEDYMGAHQAKQLIQEQEQKLQLLRQELDSMPTPSRSPRGPRVSSAAGASSKPSVAAPDVTPAPALAATEERGSDSPAASAAGSAASTDGEGGSDTLSEDISSWQRVPDQPGMVQLQSDESGKLPFMLPSAVFDRLYPYQRTGVAWMARLFQRGIGGVLADEMGLGKTIQVCALLNGARKAGATHALLCLPVTLLDQWAKEARVWCPGWPVYTYHGTAAQRSKALRGIRRPIGGLLLTSYSLMSSNGSNLEDLLQVLINDAPEPTGRKRGRPAGKSRKRQKLDGDDEYLEFEESEDEVVEPEMPGGGSLPAVGACKPWDLVVCDEAHKMKNMSSLLSKSLRKLSSNCRILLTGTPVQNALQDLWALMDFAQPGLLGNHATFVKTFSDPIDRGSVRGAKPWAVELKRHLSEQLRALMAPYLLRRTKQNAGLMGGDTVAMKDDELESQRCEGEAPKLPPKKEAIVWLYPSEEQMSFYQKVLGESEVIREASSKQKMGVEVFRAIGLLKQLCNHPMFLLPDFRPPKEWNKFLQEISTEPLEVEADEPEPDEPMDTSSTGADVDDLSELVKDSLDVSAGAVEEEEEAGTVSGAVEAMIQALPRHSEALLQQSAKLRCLAHMLPSLAARGHRTLVFSASKKMLDLIQVCCLKPRGLRCLRVDGETDTATRAAKVKKFNLQPDRFQCMLLTTAVGGVGLNLTSADRVILVDPSWNPATDAQAVDRAFRIGQTKEVRVYRLVMSGMIEDKMFRLQVFKMGLTKSALETEQAQRYFTSREIRALFEWVDPSLGETRQMLESKHGKEPDAVVESAAVDDGAHPTGDDKGWIAAGPAVGLSNFSLLGQASASEEDGNHDEEFFAQVAEAKEKLDAADAKLQQKQQQREQAEAHRDQAVEELEKVNASLEEHKERRQSAEEAAKQKRAELAQARRVESAAQLRLDKSVKQKHMFQEKQAQAQQAYDNSDRAAQLSSNAAVEASQNVDATQQAFMKLLDDAEKQLGIVDDRGRAIGDGAADAAPDRLRKVHKALAKVKKDLDTADGRQQEYEAAEEELIKADSLVAEAECAVRLASPEDAAMCKETEMVQRCREREKTRIEGVVSKTQQQADSSREKVLEALQAFTESGNWFAESLQKTQSRPVKADQVKAAVTATKAVFRPLKSSWDAVKKARIAQVKALGQRRLAGAKAAQASLAVAEAKLQSRGADEEHAGAEKEEAQLKQDRTDREAALVTAEAAKTAAEQQEAEVKNRRDELKGALPAAKEAVKAAQKAEKEATAERQALHTTCSKREREQEKLEAAKSTAVKNLKAEEYDSRQVQKAYDSQRGL